MRVSIRSLAYTAFHPDYRWDAEYLCFEPEKNSAIEYVPIGEVLRTTQYGLSLELNEEGIGTKTYRMNEISNMMCDRTILKYARIGHADIATYDLKDRDVLFNRTNSQAFVGRSGIFRKFSDEHIVFASYLVRLRTKSKAVLPEYLVAFLNTRFGISDVKRRARISINQSNVNANELKRVEIPLLDRAHQLLIQKAFDASFAAIQESERLYAEADSRLLEELSLSHWCPHHTLTFQRTYSDTASADRLDAEYFQPRYTKLLARLKKYPGGCGLFGNAVDIKAHSFVPSEEQNYKYIELANIAGNGEISGCTEASGAELPSRARRRVSKGDVIVSSIEGSLDSAALIGEDYDKALCSTGFHVLRSTEINSETLLVLMKSIVGQLQLKKGCSGTILAAINRDALRDIVLPMIDDKCQRSITDSLRASFNSRDIARKLVNAAKQSVEIAIEKNEPQAQAWLSKQLEGLSA